MLIVGSSIDYDAANELIYVVEGGYNGYPARLLSFSRLANGNAAPARSICSANLPENPIGVAVVRRGPNIFKASFEPSGC